MDQLADIMTHVITSGPFHISLSKLGMCDIYVPARGGELMYTAVRLIS